MSGRNCELRPQGSQAAPIPGPPSRKSSARKCTCRTAGIAAYDDVILFTRNVAVRPKVVFADKYKSSIRVLKKNQMAGQWDG